MNLIISKAERKARKARILLAGPSGSGKTMTALKLATGLKTDGRILFLDTEKGSATLYADSIDFDHADLPDVAFDTYISAIKQAGNLGYEVLVIDSASHAWESLLADKEKMQGNSWANWAKITPRYDALVRAMLDYPGHIIVTVRAKMKYEQGDDKKVKPIGLDPIMRDGFEYEFDLFGMIDIEHNMSIRKTRIEKFSDKIITKVDSDLGEAIRDWLASGKKEIPVTADENPLGYVIQTEGSSMKGKSIEEIIKVNPKWITSTQTDPKRQGLLTKRDVINILAVEVKIPAPVEDDIPTNFTQPTQE